jgi:hypothetical protein
MIATDETLATNQAAENARASEGSTVYYCERCGSPMIAAPALYNEDGSIVVLRCFVRLGNGCFVAECIDLDISAEADTLEAAIAGLQDAMTGYLEVAFEGLATDEKPSVLRLSPLSHRIRYHLDYFKYRLVEFIFRTHGSATKKFYEVPSGMVRSHCGA